MGTFFKVISGFMAFVIILALIFLFRTRGIDINIIFSLVPSVIACLLLFSLGSLYDKYDALKHDLDEIRESISDLAWKHIE